jgi:hypothetical protein
VGAGAWSSCEQSAGSRGVGLRSQELGRWAAVAGAKRVRRRWPACVAEASWGGGGWELVGRAGYQR